MAADSTLAYALAYVRRGWPVFPVKEDKTPATRRGFHDATCDEAAVRRWFDDREDYGIGVACGDRLAVLDIDPRHDERGMPLATLLADLGPLPADAPRVATQGGGLHVWFAGPHRTVARVGGRPWAEIRGQGAYVVAPPSIGPSGRQYTFLTMPGGPLPALPKRLRDDRVAARPAAHYAQLASSVIGQGERHNTARSLIGHLLARGVDPRVAWPLIEGWNTARCRPPLPDGQLERLFIDLAERERRVRR